MKNKERLTTDLKIKILDIKDEIQRANKIAIFTHINCDCDAVSSMCALYEYLQENGKNASMFCDSDLPEKYKFLNFYDRINTANLDNSYDLMIAVDLANSSRLGKFEDAFFKRTNINIDHHFSNDNFAKITYLRPYSSCGEVLYEIFKEMPYQLSEGVATSLFAGISGDTNHFLNSDVTSQTYKFAGELVDLKADVNKVNTYLHKHKTKEQLKLAGYMATNLISNGAVSYILITQKILEKLNVKSSDVSNYLTLISNVDNTKITILIKEKMKNCYKVSFRSIGKYDVNAVANVFGGGGHKNAAACETEGKENKIIKDVLNEAYKEIERVDNDRN
jgi:phosphoesterase RecJ-like protein